MELILNIQIKITFPEQTAEPIPVRYVDWRESWRSYPFYNPATWFPGKFPGQSETVNQPLFVPIMPEGFITETGFLNK